MKISVVISTYNGEKYIEEQMKSILAQTKQPDEVLVFDDCSSDTTVQIVQKFIKDNDLKNWKLTVNESNKGWRRNFMEGLSKADGDILFTSDQDDIWFPGKLEEMSEIMQKHPEIHLLCCKAAMFFGNTPPSKDNISATGKLIKVSKKRQFLSMDNPGCTYCFTKKLYNEAMGIWKTSFAHDAILWRAALIQDGAWIYDKPLIWWRKHAASSFTIEDGRKRNKTSRIEILDTYIEYLRALDAFANGDDSKKILKKNYDWCELRKRFYTSKNPICGLRLFGSLNLYRNLKHYLSDWVIAYFW